jgi:hypothetical protein
MTLFRYAAVAAAMILIPTAVAAQGTPEQRAACTGDAFEFCGPEIPDPDKVGACLRKNMKQISADCRAQFRPASARARKPATPVADASARKHQPLY